MNEQHGAADPAQKHKLHVLLTCDVELSSSRPFRTSEDVRRNVRDAIYGGPEGRFGLPFQLETTRRHGLKGVVFLEALCADVVGPAALSEIADLVRSYGHEVQLHVHTEWLRHYPETKRRELGIDRDHDNIGDFDRTRQTAILRHALSNLRAAGISGVRAFRAGNFGASAETLDAVSAVGLDFDASYNACFAAHGGVCRVGGGAPILDQQRIAGVAEVPVTCFEDGVMGLRPLQVCSVSLAEMRRGLRLALAARRHTAVVVSHSFELLNRARTKANPIHVARFVGLCRFLAEQRGTMPAVGFADLDPAPAEAPSAAVPLRSSAFYAVPRMGMQLLGRIYG